MSSCSSSSFSLLKPLTFPSTPCPSPALLFHNNPIYIPFKTTSNHSKTLHLSKRLTIPFALTESDSPKSLQPDLQTLLQQLADSFDLPSDYFSQLPNDLRLDLNDAAFDLSNGPVIDECGMELGKTLLNLSRAWESADTSTSYALASKVPLLANSLTDSAKSAFGRRLVAAGRRFQAMGQYGQGELQKLKIKKQGNCTEDLNLNSDHESHIAKAMNAAGKLLSASSMSATTEEQPKTETRMFKFGELQVEVTSEKANIGAAIGFVFGNLSWQIAQGIQSIPESSLEYANDNALLLAKSLRGALLAVFYSSTILSVFTTIGLLLLGRQLKSEGK
ncbi:uncharacterized protein LOC108462592 isoform X1 [Gossypium arboreum]|uniref:uncharacterized protein LOC108462592 isoform X1 n=1 Tax=Gossypium arboreum TaxID=29729 RepID=UPI0022F14C13|nr:uncharacterized protein LOC108462592 isoform X1 [Gossypium arboreum]